MAGVEEDRPATARKRKARRHFHIRRHAGHGRAIRQHARVANNDQVGCGQYIRVGQDARGQFRTDARRVTHRERNERAVLRGANLVHVCHSSKR